jgi:anti-sigma regulatory factor (Ser/Thr protein kinase)
MLMREWQITSDYGNEKMIMMEIGETIKQFDRHPSRLEDVLTAVSEACLNAMEHGNGLQKDLPVTVRMELTDTAYIFRIYDAGEGFETAPIPARKVKDKLTEEDPRGWGLFLISRLANEMRFGWDEGKFYMEIIFYKIH